MGRGDGRSELRAAFADSIAHIHRGLEPMDPDQIAATYPPLSELRPPLPLGRILPAGYYSQLYAKRERGQRDR